VDMDAWSKSEQPDNIFSILINITQAYGFLSCICITCKSI